ncbi:hypothetical protein TUBRATIS_000930, partial [Tubulinosema ratisbonensis]
EKDKSFNSFEKMINHVFFEFIYNIDQIFISNEIKGSKFIDYNCFELNINIINKRLDIYMKIPYNSIHNGPDFRTLIDNHNLLRLLLEIFKVKDFKKLQILCPEINIVEKVLQYSKIRHLNIFKIYFMVMLFMTKLKITNLLLFENKNDLFIYKFIPIYKIKIIIMLKFSIRCHQIYQYKSFKNQSHINIEYIKLLAYLCYCKLDNKYYSFCKNDKEHLLERDYYNHQSIRFNVEVNSRD